jgi:hypothetical protein
MKYVIIFLKVLWWIALGCALYFFSLELLGYGGSYYMLISVAFMFIVKNRIYVIRLVEISKTTAEAGEQTTLGCIKFIKEIRELLDEGNKPS